MQTRDVLTLPHWLSRTLSQRADNIGSLNRRLLLICGFLPGYCHTFYAFDAAGVFVLID